MAKLCVNTEKAKQRSLAAILTEVHYSDVAFNKFLMLDGTPRIKSDDYTVYSMPAQVWDFEQHMVSNARIMQEFNLKGRISLHCFENDPDIYDQENNSRIFHLAAESPLYKNLDYQYTNGNIPPNQHCKKNFCGWFDFCGWPTPDKLDVVFNKNNYVKNSLIFVTFANNWRLKDCIDPEIYSIAQRIKAEKNFEQLSDAATDAVEAYASTALPKGWKIVLSQEYQAARTPMTMLGFTNCKAVIDKVAEMEPFGCLKRRKPKTTVRKSYYKKVTDYVDKKELNIVAKIKLDADLLNGNYYRDELCEKYGINAKQVSAAWNWIKRRGDAVPNESGYRFYRNGQPFIALHDGVHRLYED